MLLIFSPPKHLSKGVSINPFVMGDLAVTYLRPDIREQEAFVSGFSFSINTHSIMRAF